VSILAALGTLGCGDAEWTEGENVSQVEENLYVHNVPLFNDTFTVDVCFLNPGYGIERATIESVIRDTWESVSGLDFQGFADCVGDPNALSIEFRENGPGGYANSGKGARVADNPDAQIVLAFDPTRTFIQTGAAHEVGHAIGFIHEHQRPDRDSSNLCSIDPDDSSNFDTIINTSGHYYTSYDLDSIMNYCRDWDHNGDDDYLQGDDFWELSPLDIAGAKLLYGYAPSERAVREAAFVTTGQLTGSFTPEVTLQWNSTGRTNRVTSLGTGEYTVVFPGVGSAMGGNVQVNSFNSGSNRCKVGFWGTNQSNELEVRVRCFTRTGTPANSLFSASYVGRNNSPGSEGGYAWASDPSSPSYNPDSFYSWNSSGQPIIIQNTGTGRYDVTFASQTIPGGTAEVTAYGFGTEYCKIMSSGNSLVQVACFDTNGNPANTFFTVRYSKDSPQGTPSYSYLSATQHTNPGPYTPDLTRQKTFQSHGNGGSETAGPASVTRPQTGRYNVTFNGMMWRASSPRYAKANVYVTATGGLNGNYCNVVSLGGNETIGTANINCYAPNGSFVDQAFTVTFSSLLTQNQPQILAHSPNVSPSARGMGVSSTWVTYAEAGMNGRVRKVHVNGGVKDRHDPANPGPDKQLSLATVPNGAFALTTNSTTVFWTVNSSSGGGVFKMPLDGGSVTQIWSGSGARAIAVSGSNAFFTTMTSPGTNSGTVRKVSVNGGSATTLVSNQGDPIALAVDGTNVFWTNLANNNVRKVSVNGGSATTIASNFPQPSGIAIDSSSVYFLSSIDGGVRKVGKNGGSVVQLATGQAQPAGIAVDANWVFWGDSQAGAVKKVNKLGGATPLVLTSGQNLPRLHALDLGNVYFSTLEDSVKKVRK
jgi:hypothetical protein